MDSNWSDRLKRCADGFAGIAMAAAFVAAGSLLVVEIVRANRDVVRQSRRRETVDREIERIRAQNDSLRAEIRSLEEDPVFVESVLRQRKRVGPGEAIVERGP